MVLKHVPQTSRLFVIAPPVFHAQCLGGSDLYVGYVMAVPYRLDDRVRETEGENVPHRFLAEIMIDAVDLRLVEDLVDRIVETSRAAAIMTEWFFDDETRPRRCRHHSRLDKLL